MTQPLYPLNHRNIVAVIWDFDKTLIPGYMQAPLFKRFNIDETVFWEEVNSLPEIYEARGTRVSKDTVYLNHLLSYIKNGPLKGLRNADLQQLGKELTFYPGLPQFFADLKQAAHAQPIYAKHDIHLEHYIISTGLAEIIRGSSIATEVDDIFACEFVENPLPPNFSRQDELPIETTCEISQIGTIVDNTIKTRFIFELNKGTNKNPAIDVNATMAPEDRRIPIQNMIYIADGPSDVPVFSVVRKGGGKTYAVYHPEHPAEFAQNDALQQEGRVNAYGPANYTRQSSTALWLRLHVEKICDRIVKEREAALALKMGQVPRHLHPEDNTPLPTNGPTQNELF